MMMRCAPFRAFARPKNQSAATQTQDGGRLGSVLQKSQSALPAEVGEAAFALAEALIDPAAGPANRTFGPIMLLAFRTDIGGDVVLYTSDKRHTCRSALRLRYGRGEYAEVVGAVLGRHADECFVKFVSVADASPAPSETCFLPREATENALRLLSAVQALLVVKDGGKCNCGFPPRSSGPQADMAKALISSSHTPPRALILLGERDEALPLRSSRLVEMDTQDKALTAEDAALFLEGIKAEADAECAAGLRSTDIVLIDKSSTPSRAPRTRGTCVRSIL